VQALRLCTGRTAHRGWGVSVTPRPLFTFGKDLLPIVQEAGWAPGPVWTGAENLTPTGIRSLDRPACSQSLYRLCFLAQILSCPWYIHYLLQWCWFPICVFIWVPAWQRTHIVELISTGDGQIMGTPHNVGKNCLCWLHWKNISGFFHYCFVCLCCVVPVSVHYRLCLVRACILSWLFGYPNWGFSVLFPLL